MTPTPEPPDVARLIADVERRWNGCRAAGYDTPRDKAMGLLLYDVARLLAALRAAHARVQALERENAALRDRCGRVDYGR